MKDELIYDGFRKSYPQTHYANSTKLKPMHTVSICHRKYWSPSNMRSLSIIVVETRLPRTKI